jgi:hypothetical protein
MTHRWLKMSRRAGPPCSRPIAASLLAAAAWANVGCHSPEDGRPRGGGPGGDGGNYRQNPVHVPSKLDGTREVPNPFEST